MRGVKPTPIADMLRGGTLHTVEPPPTITHTIDREGCTNSGLDTCTGTAAFAHEVFDAWAWIDWLQVKRTGDCILVRYRHSYPMEIASDLRAWLEGHPLMRRGARFEVRAG